MSAASGSFPQRTDLYHGLFLWHTGGDGHPRVSRHQSGPLSIPCPTTGRALRIATIDAEARAICPSCASHGHGGFVSFVGDLRMAYACPQCRKLIWLESV
jgi:hypothetical protein